MTSIFSGIANYFGDNIITELNKIDNVPERINYMKEHNQISLVNTYKWDIMMTIAEACGYSIPATNITRLDVSYSKCTSLLANYDNLVELNCCNSKIVEIPDNIKNLRILNCSCCTKITELSKEFTKLEELDCSFTQVTNIPDTLTNLKKISIECTKISNISPKLVNLEEIHCNHTKVRTIPHELLNLRVLEIYQDCNTTIPIPINYPKLSNVSMTFPKFRDINTFEAMYIHN